MQSLISLQVFVAIHIAAITATSWILMLNGAVGYQLLDDGTAVSIGLLLISSLVIFIGTGYIALDTGLNWTGYWEDTRFVPNQAYALYTLYQLVPLVFIVIFFCLEAFLVLRILGERKRRGGHRRQDQRRSLLNPLHPPISSNDLGVLVEHHRRRLAYANRRWFRRV